MPQKIIFVNSKKTNYFPNNSPESFGIKLNDLILENGTYKVNLSHILFNNNVTFLQEDVCIEYIADETSKKVKIFSLAKEKVNDKTSFIKLLSTSVSKYLMYKEEENCLIVIQPGKYIFNDYIMRLLGLKNKTLLVKINEEIDIKNISPPVTDILYLFCDFIENNHVGKESYPLLACISNGQYQERVFREFVHNDNNIINQTRLDSIRFWITNENFERVLFNDNVVISLKIIIEKII